MDKYKVTFETWDKMASLYQEKFMDLAMYNDSYDSFCNEIKKSNPKILEIGCGPGNITKYLLAQRSDFYIKAIDVAPNMIKLAKENNPSANFEIMDCRKINSLEETFDGLVCGFCIPYLSKKDCAKLIKDSFQLLNTNGVLYISFIEGEYAKSGFESGSSGDKAFIYYHQADYFKKILNQNHFEVLELIKKDYPKSDETVQTHTIFIAIRNKRVSTPSL